MSPDSPNLAYTTRLENNADHSIAGGLYAQISPLFLSLGDPVSFRVFLHKKAGSLQTILHEGQSLPSAKRQQIRKLATGINLFVRTEQLEEFLIYAEDRMGFLIADMDLEVIEKCAAMHNLATLAMQMLFENPVGFGVFRMKKIAELMLELINTTPVALKHFIQLRHHTYSLQAHSVNVGIYSMGLALDHFSSRLGINMLELITAYFLHDIGKSRVRKEILNKTGPLDRAEWWEIRNHPSYGERILDGGQVLTPEMQVVVMQHHERMDGMGYPHALTTSRINDYARVCSIADAFDALTTKRTFREPVEPFNALTIMKEEMNTQFDTEIFRKFVLMLHTHLR